MVDTTNNVWLILSAIFAIVVASVTMGLFGSTKNHMPVVGKTVLLTGPTQGMGRSVALKFAAKGANLFLVARNETALKDLVTELKSVAKNPSTQRFAYHVADVAVEDYAPPVVAAATAWNGGQAPDICWCIAGMATPGLFTEAPLSTLRRNTEVNFFGTAEMCHAMLRAWYDPGAPTTQELGGHPRHLILTSTVAVLFPTAGYAPYVPGKAAVRGLADCLTHETLLWPDHEVKVHIVYPGTITSPGLEEENKTKPAITHIIEAPDPVQSPDEVAEKSIRGLENGDYAVTVAWLGHLMKWASLGSSLRNNWLIDTVMAMLGPVIFLFALPDSLGKIRAHAKENGEPVASRGNA